MFMWITVLYKHKKSKCTVLPRRQNRTAIRIRTWHCSAFESAAIFKFSKYKRYPGWKEGYFKFEQRHSWSLHNILCYLVLRSSLLIANT